MYNMFFQTSNKKERKSIIEENASFIPEDQFEVILDHATKDKYNFCFVMADQNKILRNFEEVLFE